jgi:hypothetical protein
VNQSTIIFGFLFAAFLVFITQRGELPIYLGFLLTSPKKAVAPANINTAETKTSNAGEGIEASDIAALAMKFMLA